jgi:glyoxalase superfamily protein
MPTSDEKSAKNRVHLDLNPGADASPSDREAEIERLLALGVGRVDIGQAGDESWTVLADPEGCAAQPRSQRPSTVARCGTMPSHS